MAAKRPPHYLSDEAGGGDPADNIIIDLEDEIMRSKSESTYVHQLRCQCCIIGTRCICAASRGGCSCTYPFECASGTL